MTRFFTFFTTFFIFGLSPAFADTQTYDLPPIDKILTSDAIDVVYVQGPAQSVSVTTDDDEFSVLVIAVEDGELRLGRQDVAIASTVSIFDGLNSTILRSGGETSASQAKSMNIEIVRGNSVTNQVRINGQNISELIERRHDLPANIVVRKGLFGTTIKINDRPRPKVTVHVTTPQLSSLTALAGATITAQTIETDRLSLRSDAIGKIRINGQCGSLTITATDSSNIDSRHLICTDIVARADHNARLKIHGTDDVAARASHGGRIKVYGSPVNLRKSQSHRGRIATYR